MMTKSLFRTGMLLACLIPASLVTIPAFGQDDPEPISENLSPPPPLDDITERNTVNERQVLAWAPVREADIMWETRIWRVIDTREKLNRPFVAPESPLFTILSEAAIKGDLQVYSTEDDRFTKALSPDQVRRMMYKRDTLLTIDPETYEEKLQVVENETDWENVRRFRIKESWFMDSRTGNLRVRILGIAPMIDIVDENGDFLREQPLFWVYYPAARETLARHKVITQEGNYASTLTWEDWLEMRHFASFITKQNNVGDLRLQDMYSGADLLLKSQQIEEALFNREHDSWSW